MRLKKYNYSLSLDDTQSIRVSNRIFISGDSYSLVLASQ